MQPITYRQIPRELLEAFANASKISHQLLNSNPMDTRVRDLISSLDRTLEIIEKAGFKVVPE